MAKVSFNNLDDAEMSASSGNNPGSDVGFFTLKNDNDEAIVRFLCDDLDSFEILTVHDVQIGNKYRKVNCLRDPREPLDKCPLCNSGAKINNRFFIKLIQYVKSTDSQGNPIVTPKAMLWERSTSYARTLKSYLENYGPLSDVICKIIRHGKAGDMQTTYEIVPNLSKAVFPDHIYIKDTTLFGDFQTIGTIVMDKTASEMLHFLANGEFPARAAAQNNAAPIPEAPPAYVPPVTPAPPVANPTPVAQMPGQDTGFVSPAVSQPTAYPAYNQFAGNSGVDRPRRY